MRTYLPKLFWAAMAVLGAFALGLLALHRGETINAAWLVIAAVCTYLVAYRFYARFLARRVFELDDGRATPAERLDNHVDYVPTNRWVLFGHHFAAIAGAGPLVGPVLAAQMGYLPGMLWILAGVVLAGAVQDFMILFISMRRDGRSLGDLIKSELGQIPGMIALLGTFMIMVIILAVLALSGAGPQHICRMTAYCCDKPAYLAARRELGAIWKRRMGNHYPAMSMIFVDVSGTVDETERDDVVAAPDERRRIDVLPFVLRSELVDMSAGDVLAFAETRHAARITTCCQSAESSACDATSVWRRIPRQISAAMPWPFGGISQTSTPR